MFLNLDETLTIIIQFVFTTINLETRTVRFHLCFIFVSWPSNDFEFIIKESYVMKIYVLFYYRLRTLCVCVTKRAYLCI